MSLFSRLVSSSFLIYGYFKIFFRFLCLTSITRLKPLVLLFKRMFGGVLQRRRVAVFEFEFGCCVRVRELCTCLVGGVSVVLVVFM